MQVSPRLRSCALALAVLVYSAFSSGCWLPRVDAASFYLAAPLVPVGGASGGGRVEYLIDARQHTAFFELVGLLPDTEYTVLVDGAIYQTIATDPSGHAMHWAPVLTSAFDPRGKRVSVIDPDGVEVLELADPSNPSYTSTEVAPLAAFGPGTASMQTTMIGGVQSVTVNLAGADPGSWDLVADGVVQASIDASSGSGSVFLEPPGFDPSTAAIELQLDGVGYFAGAGHATIEGIDWCNAGLGVQELESVVQGNGNASLRTRMDCGRRFEVAVHNVPMAEYDVVVGGIWRGTITVGVLGNGSTVGSVSFSTDESSVGALDFDPVGQTIAVELHGAPYFEVDAFAP
jgi:hypothetical protein